MSAIIQNLSHMNRLRPSAPSQPLVTFGDVVYEPGGICGPRVQQDYQLVVMYEGEAQITVDGQEHVLPAQYDALMRPHRQEHFRFAEQRRTHHSWCAVQPDLVRVHPRLALLDQLPFCLPLTAHMHGLIELGLSMPASALGSATSLLEQLGLAALHQFVFEADSAATQINLPEAVRRAQQVIDARLAETLTLSDVAREVNVTPQHLIKLFRKHLNNTPARYLWQARVRRGVELLCATGLSVAEVAARAGFQNPFHFSRMVQQTYGRSPRELRRRAWEGLQKNVLSEKLLTGDSSQDPDP